MLEFRVNELITLKLENGQTHIYLENEPFRQCKFLLLEIPVDKVCSLDALDSIDEAVEGLDKSMERAPIGVPAEVRFWAHCSNLQVWAENNYNTALLHSNLSFPLLKKLHKLGDPIAKKYFKEEVAKRLASGHVPVVHYLLVEGYLEGFDQLESEVIFRQLESFLTTIEKNNLEFDELIFEILIKLVKLRFSRAEELLNKIIINTFNSGDLEQFLILMGSESLKYLERGGRGEDYWRFISSTSKHFFENLNQIAALDFKIYSEDNLDFEESFDEELENIIYQAQRTLNSLNKMPIPYFIRFLRNLASFPIYDISKLLDLISNDIYYHDEVKVILNNNWSKFKNLFVKVKDAFIYVNRGNKILVLKNLNISSISEIDNLERFSFLEVLDLSSNKISMISNLDKLSRLRELNLSFNQIESVKEIGSLPNLERLSLAGNKISQLEEFNKFSNLRSLNLEKNLIINFKDLDKLDKLEYLNLNENRIQVIPKFANLKEIYQLILSENNISKIDFSDFKKLKNIKSLSLYDNKINSIEGFEHLKELTNLKQIRINDNPICQNLHTQKKYSIFNRHKKNEFIPKKHKKLFYF